MAKRKNAASLKDVTDMFRRGQEETKRERRREDASLSADELYNRGNGYYNTRGAIANSQDFARKAYSDLTRAALLYEEQGKRDMAYHSIGLALKARKMYNPSELGRSDKMRLERMKKAAGDRNMGLAGAVASILGFVGALVFLSRGITGFAVSNLNSTNSNYFGVIFFIIGIIGLFFYSRKNN